MKSNCANMLQLENFETEVSVMRTLKPHVNVAGEYLLFD
jgi:hypothetical protein